MGDCSGDVDQDRVGGHAFEADRVDESVGLRRVGQADKEHLGPGKERLEGDPPPLTTEPPFAWGAWPQGMRPVAASQRHWAAAQLEWGGEEGCSTGDSVLLCC